MTTPTDPLVTMAASLEPKRAISYILFQPMGKPAVVMPLKAFLSPPSVRLISARLVSLVRLLLKNSLTVVSRPVVLSALSCKICWDILKSTLRSTMSSCIN